MLFSRQMYTLMKAGVPILRALGGLQESLTNPRLKAVVADLRASLDAGRELSAAMRRHATVFSPFYVSLVRVGETTGQLEAVFLRLYDHLEFEKEVRDRIKSALRYPAFVVVAMALALKSGVPVVQALSIVAGVLENDFIAQRIEQMRDGVERGESVLRTAAVAGIFTPVVMQMIAVGDETGELDDLMQEVAELYEREVDYEVKTLAAQIEPILIVFLGVIVTILALAVFLPIWDLASVARNR